MIALQDLASGNKRKLAEALGDIERRAGEADVVALLDEAYAKPKGTVIGITGPPGVGKSTLISALIAEWRRAGETVGVIAVDPSSRVSGGALLGDRARMTSDPVDQGIFIRSLAARGRLGGLADLAFASIVLMRALFDRVLVESVGVGQSEAEIVAVSDTVVLCIQPGSGDALQFMKSGIMEIPAIAVVTKADMGAAAERAAADLKGALLLATHTPWEIPVLATAATSGTGIDMLATTIDRHRIFLESTGALARGRRDQARAWVASAVEAHAGTRGLALVQAELAGCEAAPFRGQRELLERIEVTFRPAK
jgi:LAO/AO transport system kinase